MSEYLTYKVDINSLEFLDFLNLTPSDVNSYESLITSFENEMEVFQNNLGYEISFIDFAVNSYYAYATSEYLTLSPNSNNNLLETSASLEGLNFSSSISGSSLLAPYGGASYPMGLQEANFSIYDSQCHQHQ